jgi:hypothetical protein
VVVLGAATLVETTVMDSAQEGIRIEGDGIASVAGLRVNGSAAAGLVIDNRGKAVLDTDVFGHGGIFLDGNGLGSGASGVILRGGASLQVAIDAHGSGLHGLEAESGEIAACVRALANAGDGIALGGTARLLASGCVDVEDNGRDGLHFTGSASVASITAVSARNGRYGAYIAESAQATLSVGSGENGSTGVVVDTPGGHIQLAAGIGQNRGGGLLVRSGRVDMVGAVGVSDNTGGDVDGAPFAPFGIAVMPGAVLSMEGGDFRGSISNNEGVGILVFGSLFARKVNVEGQVGVLVSTVDPPRFPEDRPTHTVMMQQMVVTSFSGDGPFEPAGVVVIRTRETAAATASRFWMGRDPTAPAGEDVGVSSVVLGGDDALCATWGARGQPCGPVDAVVTGVTVHGGGRGVVIQHGGPTGADTAVHFVGNEVRDCLREGIWVGPSVFTPADGDATSDSWTFAANTIRHNSLQLPAGDTGAEMTFDASPWPDGLTWSIGDDGGPSHGLRGQRKRRHRLRVPERIASRAARPQPCDPPRSSDRMAAQACAG